MNTEQADVSASDQAAQVPIKGEPDAAHQQPPAAAVAGGLPQMPAIRPAAAACKQEQGSGSSLPVQGPLPGQLAVTGLLCPMELEEEEAPAAGIEGDPLSCAGMHLHAHGGMWASGSSSRGTTPSSTTSSSGGRLQPQMDGPSSAEPPLMVSQSS